MNTRSTTRWVVALTGIGSLVAALDSVVVGTAVPTIRTHLGVAMAVATFAAAGAYGSVSSFFDGLAPAIGVMAALSAIGALAASALPSTAGELIHVVPVPQEAG